MELTIRPGGTAISVAERARIEEKVRKSERYLTGLERAEVRFLTEHNPRIAAREVCEITVHGHGRVVRARAAATDPVTALDLAMERLQERLTRLKGRLVGRSHPRHRASASPGPGAGAAAGGSEEGEPAASGPQRELVVPEDPGGVEARIVRVKRFGLKPMTPAEAVLEMELLSHNFFFFTNAESGKSAVVYRREDGDVGLIEST